MTVLIHPFDPPFSAIILERKKCNTNITQALKHLGKHLQTTKVFWIPCFLMPFWGSFWGMPPRILVWGFSEEKIINLFWSDRRGDDHHPQLKGLHLPDDSQTWWYWSSHIFVAKEQYQDDKGITFVCTPCPPGTSQPFGAQVACQLCNAGEHQPESGSASCRRCNSGSYQVSTESNKFSKGVLELQGFSVGEKCSGSSRMFLAMMCSKRDIIFWIIDSLMW